MTACSRNLTKLEWDTKGEPYPFRHIFTAIAMKPTIACYLRVSSRRQETDSQRAEIEQ